MLFFFICLQGATTSVTIIADENTEFNLNNFSIEPQVLVKCEEIVKPCATGI